MSKRIGATALCLSALMLASCNLWRKPAPPSDVPPPPAQAAIPCQSAPVLPLPATNKALAAWVLQSEGALAACEAKRRGLWEAWPDN